MFYLDVIISQKINSKVNEIQKIKFDDYIDEFQ